MVSCDVVIVGGGPAGSTCAWTLREAGCDVVVMDAATFPRDKPCAGWITPPVVAELALDVDDYRRTRTFQAITGFRTGVIGRRDTILTTYGHPVSFAIRRCEFDEYLLRRTGARVMSGEAVRSLRRAGADWIVNEKVRAPMLVGAGGHFCPVARRLNGDGGHEAAPLVVAQEIECALDGSEADAGDAEIPELFFARDLSGYGWRVRKQGYANVGFGRTGRQLPRAIEEFKAFLVERRSLPIRAHRPWRGHAYLLRDAKHRRVADAGVVLVGDAAGLASPHSGEGIRQAVQSGRVAAFTIVDAAGRYTRERLEPYATRIFAGVVDGWPARVRAQVTERPLTRTVGRSLLGMPWFVRHVVLDRWFLDASAAGGLKVMS